ncbi:MAG: nucleotidyltransferase domain-containing protein [Elusimicrobiota bacterium]|jgi:predicted nucleotidyltransferase|nr:nucleotidyltransferase domain-containing protein [Elusimicrobiota bacterium]
MDKRRIDKEIKNVAIKYAKELKRYIKLDGLYVFGSYIKGTQHEYSDIDILIVASKFPVNSMIEAMAWAMFIGHKVDIRIEPHPILTKDFLEENSILLDMIKDEMIKIA